MQDIVVLSHGLESGPQASKISALAAKAVAMGWREIRPDYRDLDAGRHIENIDRRIERLLAHIPAQHGRLVLAGSSLGAFIAGFASLKVKCQGLFLLAPPISIAGYSRAYGISANVPTHIVHGWGDELIPASEVFAFAQNHGATLHLVDDAHRLAAHVENIVVWFEDFLATL